MVAIKLDRERHLQMDLNAMIAFEEATGKSFLDIASLNSMGPKELRALLWASLKHEDPELTLEKAGTLITAASLNEMAEIIATVVSPGGDSPLPGSGPTARPAQASATPTSAP